ncbi:NRPS [Arachnomyces sp. PD_36]|nr:NRPS [Arachnomyces sp. PD_36]
MTPVKLPTSEPNSILMKREERTNNSQITTEKMDTDVLPLTKVPLLDTVDQYLIPKNLEAVFESTSPIVIPSQFKRTDVVDGIFAGYARFLSAFTGLDELAFAFALGGSNPVRPQSHGCVHALVEIANPNEYSGLQNVKSTISSDHAHELDDEKYQFGIQVGVDEQDPSELRLNKPFTVKIQPGDDMTSAQVWLSYSNQIIPKPAVQQVHRTLAAYIGESLNPGTFEQECAPDLSVVNFPASARPVSFLQGGRGISSSHPPGAALLQSAFEQRVKETPELPALDFLHSLDTPTSTASHSVLSYRELNIAAIRLAERLKSAIPSHGETGNSQTIIPVYMSTSPELYISYLGILKAGFAFCPIPLDAPDQRVLEILEDIDSPVILGRTKRPTSGPCSSDGNVPDRKWLNVADVTKWESLGRDGIDSSPAPTVEILPSREDDVAYLLYTSGSTGKPKGVQISHLAATCSINSHASVVPLPHQDPGTQFRWFQFASPTFDPSLMEIFVTLGSGSTLCSAERSLSLTDMEATVTELGATIMMATPSLAALLRPSRLPTLQYLWTMGEKLNRTVIENFANSPHENGDLPKQGSTGQRTLVNAYGPTEAAINCTFLGPVGFYTRGSIIGQALPTCSLFVLDPNSPSPRAIPSGLAGELAIGGPQVSKGYLNRPKETAKAFVHSPQFGYIYRTGDMARIVWDENGSQVIEFLGRISSDQVKVNGRRLELGEIESVVSTISGVKEIVSIVNQVEGGMPGSEQLVACIVLDDDTEHERDRVTKDARDRVSHHLPSYMWPSTYVFLQDLPRSSAGKVNRKAIAATFFNIPKKAVQNNGIPAEQTASVHSTTLQDMSYVDRIIHILASITHEDAASIKPSTNLYTLGIDSLGAMRFLQNARDAGLHDLSVGDVLRAGTPAALAEIVAQQSGNMTSEVNGEDESHTKLDEFSARNKSACLERLHIQQEQVEKILPTTATQSGMLASFLRSSSSGTRPKKTYIYHTVLHIDANTDIARLKCAWETVIRRYDSFRTLFCWLDDDMAPFAQCILSEAASPEVKWDAYVDDAGNGYSMEGTISHALREAESRITLDSPPWRLATVAGYEKKVVVLSMFHGIFDGGSLELLLHDVSAEYHGKPHLDRVSIGGIVHNHFEADQESTLKFWSDHLDQYSPVPFPCLTGLRPEAAKEVDSSVEIIAETNYTSLRQGSRELGSTPLAVIQAAWSSILCAYSGSQEQDAVFGSVVSGRLDRSSEICIGPTFTTIPIRVRPSSISGDLARPVSSSAVARYLTSLNAETLQYLQPKLGSLVTADGQLPYDTLLAFQDFSTATESCEIWNSIENPSMANDFAVMIEVWPSTDGSLRLKATFSDTHLDPTSAEVMLQQMSGILAHILSNPEEAFAHGFSKLQSPLLSTFNSDPAKGDASPDEGLLQSQFEKHARDQPDSVALVFIRDLESLTNPQNLEWTYSQLNHKANRLAEFLVGQYGWLTGVVVPLCIEKSPELYVALLGVLKSGASWCPIDTLSPSQRRHDLIARTGARMVLVSDCQNNRAGDSVPEGLDIIDVSRFAEEAKSHVYPMLSTKEGKPCTPDDTAYMLWTSGTTGPPKGVPIKHSAAVASMKSLQQTIPTDVKGGVVRCLQFSQYTFDVSVQDFFYTWGLGGVLISAPREVMLGSFAKLANTTRATHAHLTPAFSAGVSRKSCETLEVVTMIGEKLTQAVADDWGQDMRAFNTYGPAETTIVSTVRQFGGIYGDIKSSNIGWPLSTVSVFVVKDGKVVMKHSVGELVLGGPQLSAGYLNQPETTKKKFVWNEDFRQQVYHTGDLVRMLQDGSLEYINRVDDLVKFRGMRVELSEISFALSDCHTLVDQVETLVLNRPDRPTDVAVAFLAASEAFTGSSDEAVLVNDTAVDIGHAAVDKATKALPDYMQPSVYLVIKSIPKTPSAKTDRAALRSIYASVDLGAWETSLGPMGSESMDEDETSRDREILDIVCSFSGVDPKTIKKSSRLVALGVDSIRAIRLASRLNESGFQISVFDVLRCSTLQNLISLVSPGNREKTAPNRFDIAAFNEKWGHSVAAKVNKEFIVTKPTSIQESLLSETMGNVNMYWSHHFFSLDDSVDLVLLQEAWRAVASTTEALRTGFIPVAEVGNEESFRDLGSSVLQLIYQLPMVDWEIAKCTESEYDSSLRERLTRITSRHQKEYFRYPPWAISIFDQGDLRKMVFSIHHSLHDGPSFDFIQADLYTAYENRAPSGKPRNQLQDALSLLIPSSSEEERDDHRFWAEALGDFTDPDGYAWPDLSGKRKLPGQVEEEICFISDEIELALPTGKLETQSAASIIRAAWGCILLNYLGTHRVVFGETLSDRLLDPALEDVVGPLISVVPVPFQAQGTCRDLLTEQAKFSMETFKHRHTPAREIRKLLKRPRESALYPALFTFHPSQNSEFQSSNAPLWSECEDEIGLTVEHPMALNAFQGEDGKVVLKVSSQASLMSRDHLAVLVHQAGALVNTILDSPEEQVCDIVNLLPPSLRSITEPNITEHIAAAPTRSPTFWLEHYASHQPQWPAVEVASVIDEDNVEKESLTFGELNAQSNRVAAYIAEAGIDNKTIALCAGRTLASYPIITGIFKSGNTYLPIDEGLPKDRKAFLVEDADCALIFTEIGLSDTFSGVPESCHAVYIDDPAFQNSLSSFDPADRQSRAHPDDASYLLYTSGSTGKPKGVLVTRGNLSSFIEGQSDHIYRNAPATKALGGTGKYLALASRAFDVHIAEIFLAWRSGFATVTGPRWMLLDDLRLALTKLDITHASFVPSLLDQADLEPSECPKLVYLSVGGEKISQRVLDTWGASNDVVLVNAYGPTELTIGCSTALVTPETNMRNIGHPLGSCVAHVLVPETQTYTLRGQAGELCFTGDYVAKGYHKRPDAAGFVEDFNGARMYRTGDIGRLMADDSIEYLGRGDDQTKIRGQRLELGEVSEVIRSSSSTNVDVVTMLVQHPELARVQLASFVASSEARQREHTEPVSFLEKQFTSWATELQDACKQKLPSYMVPEVIMPVNFIPLAPMSGKADIKQLQALLSEIPLSTLLQHNRPTANGSLAVSHREATSDEEGVINAILSIVSTDRSMVSHTSNIFEIGIDSLSAISLSVKLRNLGYDVDVATVMSNPVIEQLALLPRNQELKHGERPKIDKARQHIQCLESLIHKNPPKGLDMGSMSAIRPCLPLQEGLIARSINGDDNQLYVNHIILRLSDSLDVMRLRYAWEETAWRTEILRTVFAPLDQGIPQVILKNSSHHIRWQQFARKSINDALDVFRTRQQDITGDILNDLFSVPPVRFEVALSEITGHPLALMISIHHSLYDGESFSMILEDVATRYNKGLTPLRGSPEEFVEHIHSEDFELSKDHWLDLFHNFRPTIFPKDSEPVKETATTVHRTFELGISELDKLSSAFRTTTPSLLQSIFALLLAEARGVSDVTYGAVLSGRSVPVSGASSVLLPCITTVPNRLDVSSLSNIADVVHYVRDSSARSLKFQHTPIRYIQRWLESDQALFDCLFSFIRNTKPHNQDLWEEVDSHMPGEYPLAVEMEANYEEDQLVAHCAFTSYFGSVSEADGFLEKMEVILHALAKGDEMPLTSFDITSTSTSAKPISIARWDEDSWSPVEEKLREIVSQACDLPMDKISKNASFLSLGIDSVTAISFARSLRGAGFPVSSSGVMQNGSVGALADYIKKQPANSQNGYINGDTNGHTNGHSNGHTGAHVNGNGADTLSAYKQRVPLLSSTDSISAVFECTPLQAGMLTQTVGSTGNAYVHHHTVRLFGQTNTDRLRQALIQVIDRNDILRSSFHAFDSLDSAWIGAVHNDPPLSWEESHSGTGSGDLLEAVGTSTSLGSEKDFESPPLKAWVLTSGAETYLTLMMHHSLYDGVSLPFIFDDLELAYLGNELPVRPVFSDIVGRIHEGQELAIDFWTQKLLGYNVAPVPRLPQDEASANTHFAEKFLKSDIFKVIKSCKVMEVTVQTVCLLAFAKVLACLTGCRDNVFGHVVSGRSLPVDGAESTIGPLFNTVPLRIRFDSKLASNKELATRIQKLIIDSQDHQHAPLRAIQNKLRHAGEFDGATLFDPLFVFQKAGDPGVETSPRWKLWESYDTASKPQAEHPLNIEVEQTHNGVIVRATCQGQYLSQAMLDMVLSDFEDAFQDIIESPTRCATALPEKLQQLPLQAKVPKRIEDAPQGPVDEKLQTIIRQVLSQVASVPIDMIKSSTSIYNIGLDSIAAIRIASVCRSEGLKAGVADILQGTTPMGIAQRIAVANSKEVFHKEKPLLKDHNVAEGKALELLGVPKDGVESVLPCLAGQMYHLVSWLKSGRTLFEPAWMFSSRERLYSERLKESFFKLRQRHPILRTCFAAVSPTEAVQVVLKEVDPDDGSFEFIRSMETSSEEAVIAQAKLEATKPSSLLTPPVRLRHIRGERYDAILLLIHHSAYDAWSMPLLVSELAALYSGSPSFDSNPHFPQFIDHSVRSLRNLPEKKFWTSALEYSTPTLISSRDKSLTPLSYNQLFVGASNVVPDVRKLEQKSRKSGLGLQTIVILSVARALSRLTTALNPTFALYQAGRSAAFDNVENMSGPCLNVTPFTVPNALPTTTTAASTLESARLIQSTLAEQVPYEQSSLRDILNWLGFGNGETNPLFNVWLNLLWHNNDTTATSDPPGSASLFSPLSLSPPTDFLPEQHTPPTTPTPVSSLDQSHLPNSGLYVDIGPDQNTDSLSFGIRAEGGILTEDEVRDFIKNVGEEIQSAVREVGV